MTSTEGHMRPKLHKNKGSAMVKWFIRKSEPGNDAGSIPVQYDDNFKFIGGGIEFGSMVS